MPCVFLSTDSGRIDAGGRGGEVSPRKGDKHLCDTFPFLSSDIVIWERIAPGLAVSWVFFVPFTARVYGFFRSLGRPSRSPVC